MKNKIIKIVVIIFSAIILLLSNTACLPKPMFAKKLRDSSGVWACNELIITQYDVLYNPGKLYLEGNELEILTADAMYGQTLNIFNRERYESLELENMGDVCIWEVNYKWKSDNLTLTVSKDYAYERGESQVDYTGKKFYLEKQSDPDSSGIEKFRHLSEVEGTWSCDDLNFSNYKDNYGGELFIDGQQFKLHMSTSGVSIWLYATDDSGNAIYTRKYWTCIYAWKGEDLMICVVFDDLYETGVTSVSYQGTKFLLKKQQ